MKLIEAAHEAISITVQAGHIPYIENIPGIGKSAFTLALGRSLELMTHIEILSIADATDIKGQPYRSEDGVRFAPSKWLRDANNAKNLTNPLTGRPYKGALVFFDEIPNAEPPVMAGALTLMSERRAGETKLEPHVHLMAAGNPVEISPNGRPLPAPMANRMIHLDFPIDTNAWAQGLIAGFPTPVFRQLPDSDEKSWRDYILTQRSLIAGFSKFRQTQINAMPKHEVDQAKAWPSMRTWTYAADLLGAAESIGAPKDVKLMLLKGAVGPGPAGEFLSWAETANLPDPEDLLKKPESLVLPEGRGDLQFAILGSVSGAVVANMTPARYTKGWLVMAQAAKEAPDVAASAVIAMAKARKPGCQVPKEAKVFFPLLQKAGLVDALAAK